MARTEWLGCVLGRKGVQEEEEVEGGDALSFHHHHLLHISHLLASPEGVYSHIVDLLSFSSLPERGFLFSRREAFLEKMGLVEEAWGLSALDLVGCL